jgi:betaine reductase
MGDPTLDPAAELQWRKRQLRTALRALETPVSGPTIFPVD